MTELNNFEEEEIEVVKKIISNMEDIRQVQAIHDYCYDILEDFYK